MLRYRNAWFYINASLAPSFAEVLKLVAGLRQAMHLPEYYPPFDNLEGCDFEVRVAQLQPWIDRAHRSLQHAHTFHMRYYYKPLAAGGLEKVHPFGQMVYDKFGPRRLLFGTGMVGSTRRISLADALRLIREDIPFFADADRKWILGGNAAKIWKWER